MSSSNWVDNSGYTHLELYPNGKYKSFVPTNETDWMFKKIPILLQAEMKVEFYESGYMKSCHLAKSARLWIFGVPARVASGKIELYPDGNFKLMTLSEQNRAFFWLTRSWRYRGVKYDAGATLEFSPTGEVTSKT